MTRLPRDPDTPPTFYDLAAEHGAYLAAAEERAERCKAEAAERIRDAIHRWCATLPTRKEPADAFTPAIGDVYLLSSAEFRGRYGAIFDVAGVRLVAVALPDEVAFYDRNAEKPVATRADLAAAAHRRARLLDLMAST